MFDCSYTKLFTISTKGLRTLKKSFGADQITFYEIFKGANYKKVGRVRIELLFFKENSRKEAMRSLLQDKNLRRSIKFGGKTATKPKAFNLTVSDKKTWKRDYLKDYGGKPANLVL